MKKIFYFLPLIFASCAEIDDVCVVESEFIHTHVPYNVRTEIVKNGFPFERECVNDVYLQNSGDIVMEYENPDLWDFSAMCDCGECDAKIKIYIDFGTLQSYECGHLQHGFCEYDSIFGVFRVISEERPRNMYMYE